MSKNIAYILPSVGISGGIAVVLQHIFRLRSKGYNAFIIYLRGNGDLNWFSKNNIPIYKYRKITSIDTINIDIAIGTHYTTIPCLLELSSQRKIYFVQSDERRFNLENISAFNDCNRSYSLNIEFMTEALWIQRWLWEEFGKSAYYVPNGVDTAIFSPTKPLQTKTNRFRILLEGSIDQPYKGMDEAYNSVKDLDCEIWIVSYNGKPKPGWRYDRFFDNVPHNRMKEIYSACDILLKMSRVEGFFGPPLEAMACGCGVVVSKVTGYDEYIRDEYNALVVERDDIKTAKNTIIRLINNRILHKKLIDNGFLTVKEWSWEKSISKLEKVIIKEIPAIHYTAIQPEVYDFRGTVANILEELKTKDNSDQNRSINTIALQKELWLAKIFRKLIKSFKKQINTLNHNINIFVINKYNKESPLVTVLIPCYNYGRFLDGAIKSVLDQTYKNIEIIIIDDGSTDPDTISHLDCIQYPKTTIIRQNNQGLAEVRNTGFRIARGSYVCCLDPDDFLEPEYLKKTVSILEKNKRLGSAYSWVQCFGEKNDVWKTSDLNAKKLADGNTAPSHSVVRKKAWHKVFEQNNVGFRTEYNGSFEDWVFWIEMVEAGYGGKAIPEPLIRYRVHNESYSNKNKKYYDIKLAELHQNKMAFFKKHTP
jgi:glycosyltransferase involved in cell wall biosynthesis/GT2 family glycosyltransferase